MFPAVELSRPRQKSRGPRKRVLRALSEARRKRRYGISRRAHRSPKTYSVQLQRLIALQYEVEDLQADVEASDSLFTDSEEIAAALAGIAGYLKRGTDEYGPQGGHEHVAAGWKSQQPCEETIDSNDI